MKIHFLSVLLLGTLLFTGCFTVNTATSEVTGDHHLLVQNYGWRLFYAIPLACGNATDPDDSFGPWAFFRDDVTLDKVQKRFFKEAAILDGKVTDLTYCCRENILFNIPLTQLPMPVPYIICYREIQLSGVVQ